MYNYSFEDKKFWIKLNDNNKLVKNDTVIDNKEPISYYSPTGQFISNCFFFIEGIDSESVDKKINDIIKSKSPCHVLKDIKHLENQDFVSTYIFKYIIQNNQCNINLLIDCLDYLYNISVYLAKKIGMKMDQPFVNKFQKMEENFIIRCSYKFCHYTYYCQYNYPEKQQKGNKGCYSDHFVHNKVSQDLLNLIKYIKKNYTDSENLRSNQEIIKCINTIAYCIKHMYDELWNIYISTPDKENYESYHKNINLS
jgi:hypothetical protein